MELARLYPRWSTGVVHSPQVVTHTASPVGVATAVAGSLLHRGSLTDLFGMDTDGISVWWVARGYTRGARWLWANTPPNGVVSSVTHLWGGATWLEREVWEMLGVSFGGHTDLRRLLTDYGFTGAPLTRGFPCGGYLELRFSERAKRVISRPVRFIQEFRRFDFVSTWSA